MTKMRNKRVYISTIGCQMNVYDSDRMLEMLAISGYEPIDSFWRADLVLVNTCAIREKAVQKANSFVGRICGIKRARPDLILAVTGCVAQQQSDKIAERFDGVDIILGTHALHRLPEYLRQFESAHTRIIDVTMTTDIDHFETERAPGAPADLSSFVTIMRGCDNYCTYCVVPYVRGREMSRIPDRILEEVRGLVRDGAKEVTLLGQNVNSYGKKEGLCSFGQLLEEVNAINGLERIRFVTSHPKDLSDELISAFGRLEKLCNHIHLPVQSGSDRILKRMNRKYTRADYMERVEALRNVCPDIAITTDFIVGFPGETPEDFEQTLELVERVRFDTFFVFEYSDRPEAPATQYSDKIDPVEKNRRLRALFDLKNVITGQTYDRLVGQTGIVLVEGLSKKSRQEDSVTHAGREFSGRTSENRIVNFIHDDDSLPEVKLHGRLVPVRIEKACANSLWGRLVPDPSATVQNKGGNAHAA